MRKLRKQQKLITQQEIRRKIEKSKFNSAEEYQMIIENLQQQNIRLMKDRDQMKIRVDLLLEKEKYLIDQQKGKGSKNPLIDYARLKAQLEKKHKQLQNQKKKIYNSINKGALTVQVKQYLNKCTVVQNQIDKYKKMLNDERKAQRKLEKGIKIQLKKINRDVPQREDIQQENKELRRMIWNLRLVQDLTGHVDIRLHSSIVRMQSKKKIIEKLKTMTIQQIRREQAKTKIELIEENMKFGKLNIRKRINTEGRVSTAKSNVQEKLSFRQNLLREIFQSQKLRVLQQQKQRQQEQKREIYEKQLQKSQLQKIEKQSQLQALKIQENKLKQILHNQEQKLKKKEEGIILKLQTSDAQIQTVFFQDGDPLPLQIIGNQTELLQDDRAVLKSSKDTLITGLIVYENKNGLASVRALYSNGKQTACLVPEKYLSQKCKNKKVMLTDPKDYLKWVKAYYDKTQNKLIRLQIYSNNKIKFQIGKQKQLMLRNVISYKFDSNAHQIPVCLRVSYRFDDQDWILASFGIEFNQK